MRYYIISFSLIIFISFSIQAQSFKPKFFCFEDAFLKVHTDSYEYQAQLIKKLGFDGMELMGLDFIDEKLISLKKNNLQLFMVYIQIDLEKDQPYDDRLHDFIKKVKDSGVTLWVHIHSDKYSPSDSSGDKRCVSVIQDLADFANNYGVRIALYPHSGFWLEKVDHSVILTQKINRRNVGAVFNLCHFLKADEKDQLEEKLTNAIPFLSAVSINGADDGNTNAMNWSRLILPLGEGSFNVLKVLEILRNNKYSGPVGLQCFNIEGEPSEFLEFSVKTWNEYLKLLSLN